MDEVVQRAGAQGRAGNRHRHGPPRPPERAGQHAGQDAGGPVRRIRTHRADDLPVGRREVPPGLLVATSPPPAARSTCRSRSIRRTWKSSTRWSKARSRRAWIAAATTTAQCCRSCPRRRGLRRPGRGDGNAEPGADARLRHRRHGAHRHQQPDRLHHLGPARLALDAVLHRRRQDDRSAGAARERRRSGSGRAVHAARDRLPPGVQQGRRRRHRLLPQAGPQRAGHAGADAAADVQEDRRSIRARASCTRKSWWRRA